MNSYTVVPHEGKMFYLLPRLDGMVRGRFCFILGGLVGSLS